MPRKNEVAKKEGACWASAFICCPNGETSPCWKCGWNPDNGVRERRVKKAMREYRRKLRDGQIFPPWW